MLSFLLFFFFFFFLMIRRPPRSTLFPSRRSSDLADRRFRRVDDVRGAVEGAGRGGAGGARRRGVDPQSHVRSEEHTSELQSPCNIVCRLLLEKKKKKPRRAQTHTVS